MSKTVIVIVCVAAALLALPFVMRVVRPANGTPPNQSASAGTAPAAAPAISSPAAFPPAPPGTPAIVATDPANSATNVPSGLKEIRVTFNTPMGGGFSWTGGGPTFPGAPGMKPYWTPDRQTCVLPVALHPNGSYRLGLNSPSHKNFKSESGAPLPPVVWTFSTGN